MPPKKKRRGGNTRPEPGVAKTYLQENFASFPTTADEVRNGHVLHVYMTSGEYSVAECDRQLGTLIEKKLDLSTNCSHKVDINRIVLSTLKKYHNLRDPWQLSRFKLISEKPFTIRLPEVTADSPCGAVGDDSIQPDHSGDVDDASLELCPPLATLLPTPLLPDTHTPSTTQSITDYGAPSSTTRSRSQPFTPREEKLRKRLAFSSQQIADLRRKVRDLKKQLRTPKRVTNQALRRKIAIIAKRDRKIQDLRRQLSVGQLTNELANTKEQIAKLQNAHQKLKLYHWNKDRCSETITIVEHRQILADRDETIKSLEQMNVILQKVIDKTTSTQVDLSTSRTS